VCPLREEGGSEPKQILSGRLLVYGEGLMSTVRSGREEKLPYSLSRWTDLPASKWEWLREQMRAGSMVALDPKTGLPSRWSLDPVDTLGLIFWTRNCANLVRDEQLLRPYRKVIHFTLTGWHEVELRAPGLSLGVDLLRSAVETFGVESVTWRFSPVPLVPDVLQRFSTLAFEASSLGLQRVYVSFLQGNDWQPESRSKNERLELLRKMAEITNLEIVLCNDDRETMTTEPQGQLSTGICEDGVRFGTGIRTEGCGCALAVDPFTQNESCRYGCKFCYAGNRSTSPKKRNTTRLPMIKERQ
jgi:Domain of unknown function (DUF1848)